MKFIPISNPSPTQLEAYGRALHTLLQQPTFNLSSGIEELPTRPGFPRDHTRSTIVDSVIHELLSQKLLTQVGGCH